MQTTTAGKWYAEPGSKEHGCIYLARVLTEEINPDHDQSRIVALCPNLADAALFAVSKDMLDTLIAIQAELNTSKDVIDLVALNQLISDVFEKLANEAGEEI